MEIINLIGEATEYDKKQQLEVKKEMLKGLVKL